MQSVALITARGGSQRVPRKNSRMIAGKPLIAWTIETAIASPSVSRVVISTDDEEIASVARAFGAETPFMRPAALATDTAASVDVVLHAVDALQLSATERVVLLQPTSPLRIVRDIEDASAEYEEKGARSVVSVSPAPHAMKWLYRLDVTGRIETVPSQIEGEVFALNGAIYLCSVGALVEERTLFPRGATYAYVMPPERSIDVDTEWEFRLAERMLEVRH